MTGDATPPEPDADIGRRLAARTREIEVAHPDRDASVFGRVVNGIAEVAGVAVLVTVVGLIFANAVGRYVAGASLIWAEELVIALIPWLAMTGMFLAIRRRQVIRIEAFTEMLPPAVRQTLAALMQLVAAATLTVLAYQAFTYVTLFGGDELVYLDIPTGWFKSAMLIGAAACALSCVVDAVYRMRRLQRGAR